MSTLRAFLLLAVVGTGCAGSARSNPQNVTAPVVSAAAATISGTVVTGGGDGIPGATVVLIDNASGRRSTPVVTTAQGGYLLRNVPVGSYSLQASLSGFTPVQQTVRVATSSRVEGPTMVLVPGEGPRAVPIPLAR